jgi:hypothetical protein
MKTKRPNRKNTKLIRDILSVPNNQGNVLPYVNRVNAYCQRVGIHNKGYSDFAKIIGIL